MSREQCMNSDEQYVNSDFCLLKKLKHVIKKKSQNTKLKRQINLNPNRYLVCIWMVLIAHLMFAFGILNEDKCTGSIINRIFNNINQYYIIIYRQHKTLNTNFSFKYNFLIKVNSSHSF